VPTIVFSDLRVFDFSNPRQTGNVGSAYDRNLEHLKDCVDAVTQSESKTIKTIDRSYYFEFYYQLINNAVFLGSGNEIIMYRMKTLEEIRRHFYNWGKSALIL